MITLRPSGDTLLLIEFDAVIDPAVNARVIQLAARLQARLGERVRDVVPAYHSVGVHFDPLLTDLGALQRAIEEEAAALADAAETERAIVEIPVRYGGVDGPDLAAVAEWAGLSEQEVITRHAGVTYRVYMLGFVPGFAYMGSVDPRIAAPRRRVPRDRVPVGSVGIAGGQTGVYPYATPGGWQLIGRTDTLFFDVGRTPPSLLAPGDRVRFVPVGAR